MEERIFFYLFGSKELTFVSKFLNLGCFLINDKWTTFIPTLVDGLRKLKQLKPKLTFTWNWSSI